MSSEPQEEQKEEGAENIFKQIMAENFLNLAERHKPIDSRS